MKRTTLNIGRNVSARPQPLSEEEVVARVKQHFDVHSFRIYAVPRGFLGLEEDTFVVAFDSAHWGDNCSRTWHLAAFLQQDCIAVHHEYVGGQLCGPRSSKYGEFDDTKFITEEQAKMYSHPKAHEAALADAKAELNAKYRRRVDRLEARVLALEHEASQKRPAGWMAGAGSTKPEAPPVPELKSPVKGFKIGDWVERKPEWRGGGWGVKGPVQIAAIDTRRPSGHNSLFFGAAEPDPTYSDGWDDIRFVKVDPPGTAAPAQEVTVTMTREQAEFMARLSWSHLAGPDYMKIGDYDLCDRFAQALCLVNREALSSLPKLNYSGPGLGTMKFG